MEMVMITGFFIWVVLLLFTCGKAVARLFVKLSHYFCLHTVNLSIKEIMAK